MKEESLILFGRIRIRVNFEGVDPDPVFSFKSDPAQPHQDLQPWYWSSLSRSCMDDSNCDKLRINIVSRSALMLY